MNNKNYLNETIVKQMELLKLHFPVVFFLILFSVSPFCSIHLGAQTSVIADRRTFTNEVSLEMLCANQPEAVLQFFDRINLEFSGLENVKKAVASKNMVQACRLLIEYYKTRKNNTWLNGSKGDTTTTPVTTAEHAMSDTFTFQDIKGKLPRLVNGKRNWYYKGPNNDIEWAFFLNRHFYFNDLSADYEKTHKSKYATLYNDLITDWITSTPTFTKIVENAAWRPLEVAIRVSRGWIAPFFSFQQATEFTDVTRIMVLNSFYEHCEYLRKFHGQHHNHAVMEFISLTKVSLNFPEFKQSDAWYSEAVKGMQIEFNYSAYPDGAIKELTSHYHLVVARDFREFIDINSMFGKKLPDNYNNILENIYNYSAYTARPDGIGLLNNDSDQRLNFDIIKDANTIYKRADWSYITTNGKTGTAPRELSKMFTWAGQFIMRNGYGEKAGKDHFAFFDMGPWGSTHQHNDKLNFTLYANGRELLCDNGRMYYKGDSIKSYFNLSVGHNVISINDKGQNQYETINIQPVDSSSFSIQPDIDFAISNYNGGFDDKSINARSYSPDKSAIPVSGKHTRAVIYLKNKYWIVVDNIITTPPAKLTAHWHFNPDCNVIKVGNTVKSTDAGKSNLLIYPVGNQTWDINLVRGQLSPYVQGWFSKVYNTKEAAYCAEYQTAHSKNSETFAWLIFPSSNNEFPTVKTKILNDLDNIFRFEVQVANQEKIEVAINMDEIKPIVLSDKSTLLGRCAIISQGKKAIVVHGKINDKNGNLIKNNL